MESETSQPTGGSGNLPGSGDLPGSGVVPESQVPESQGLHESVRAELASARRVEFFVQQLTTHQEKIYGYIFSLLGDHDRAADVVQETNMVLWRKLMDFDPSRPFMPWALSVARFQVMAHMRDSSRDRLLLDPELAESLASQLETKLDKFEQMRVILRKCLAMLSDKSRRLVEARYMQEQSIADIAASGSQSNGAVKVALMRIRRQLAECAHKHDRGSS